MSTNIRYSKEWWKERLPLVQAWTEGKKLQFQDGCNWLDSFETCCFESPLHMYRISPELKLRPWKPEEVPLGAIIRRKGYCDRSLITETWDAPIRQLWFERNEHSTDGGRTWAPCGVMDEQQ